MLYLANMQDFETFTLIRNNDYCDVMYQSNETDTTIPFEIDDDTMRLIDEEFNIDRDCFFKYLSDKKRRIFMIKKDDVSIGFIILFSLGKRRWKISDICVLPQFQTRDLFFETLEDLKNVDYIKQLFICLIYSPMRSLIKEVASTDNFIKYW